MQKTLLIFILAILTAHIFGNIEGWYIDSMFDVPMHMAGGAWLGLFFIYLFGERFKVLDFSRHRFAKLIFAVGFVAILGIGWELHEFAVEIFLSGRTEFGLWEAGGLFDSLKDLVNDMIGGAIAAGIYLKLKIKN